MREEEAMEETTTAVRSSPASPSGSESSPGALDAWESSIELTGKGPINYLSRWCRVSDYLPGTMQVPGSRLGAPRLSGLCRVAVFFSVSHTVFISLSELKPVALPDQEESTRNVNGCVTGGEELPGSDNSELPAHQDCVEIDAIIYEWGPTTPIIEAPTMYVVTAPLDSYSVMAGPTHTSYWNLGPEH